MRVLGKDTDGEGDFFAGGRVGVERGYSKNPSADAGILGWFSGYATAWVRQLTVT